MKRRKISGMGLIELMAAMTIALLSAYVCVSALHFTRTTFSTVTNEQRGKEYMGRVDARIGGSLRNAYKVDVANSTTSSLTVIEPKLDAAGNVIAPLTAGTTYTYYLSDQSGDPAKSGTYVWRAVDGIKDSAWSMHLDGTPRLDLGPSAVLQFSFDSPTDPENITVKVQTSQIISGKTTILSASSTYFMRNHFIARS